MRKLILTVLVVSIAVACGEGSPTGTDDGQTTLNNVQFITLTEFDGYIASVQSTIPDVNLMIAEFSSIAADFNAEFVPRYWIGEYTRNLLKRVDGIRVQARRIRPQHPDLLKLHLEEYEASLEDFSTGFALFVQALDRPGTVSIDEVNDHIVDGNTHLIRLQILLGDLGGTRVDFFAMAGGGGGGPDDGFGF